jgi:hypothetical protein
MTVIVPLGAHGRAERGRTEQYRNRELPNSFHY